jgi:murein L,D-transpeptidase YcbB/YkuD
MGCGASKAADGTIIIQAGTQVTDKHLVKEPQKRNDSAISRQEKLPESSSPSPVSLDAATAAKAALSTDASTTAQHHPTQNNSTDSSIIPTSYHPTNEAFHKSSMDNVKKSQSALAEVNLGSSDPIKYSSEKELKTLEKGGVCFELFGMFLYLPYRYFYATSSIETHFSFL